MKTYSLHSSDMFGRDFVLVDDSGNTIEGIMELTVRAYPNEPVKAEITIPADRINMKVTIDTVNFHCPNCNEIVSHDCEQQTLGGK